MKTRNLIKLFIASLGCCTFNALGAEWLDQTYLHVDIGPAFVSDVAINRTANPAIPPATTTTSFDTGIRGDIAFGYQLNPSWSIEIESGAIWNSVDRVTSGSLSVNTDDDFYQIPLLLNINYRVPLKKSWSPYLGVGVGGAASLLHTWSVGNIPLSTPVRVDDTEFTFACQASAGLKYVITPSAEVDLSYKFLATLGHNWDLGSEMTLVTQEVYTHAVLVSFTWKF